MLKRTLLAASLILIAMPAMADSQLFENTCPQAQDAPYLAAIAGIESAVQSGARLHVLMSLPGTTQQFLTDVPVAEMTPTMIYGVLPERGYINNNAQVTRGDGLVGGSLDTLGHYRYAPWLFGTASPGPTITDQTVCYVIRWFGD